MRIAEYRTLVKEKLSDRLEPLGFRSEEDHLYLKQDDTYFALLRVRDKWSNLTQQVRYLAVLRHDFLPNVEGRAMNGFVHHPALYPFKVNPLKLASLKSGFFKKSINYTYKSCNLGHYDTLNIDYGQDFPIEIFEEIYNQISLHGLDWLNFLTPKEGANQISKYGKEEYIEKIWMEAYAKRGY